MQMSINVEYLVHKTPVNATIDNFYIYKNKNKLIAALLPQLIAVTLFINVILFINNLI